VGPYAALAEKLGVSEANAELFCQQVRWEFPTPKPSRRITIEFVGAHYKPGKSPKEIAARMRASGWQPKAKKSAKGSGKTGRKQSKSKQGRRNASVWTISIPMGGQPPKRARSPDPLDDL
jgi:hypothetical protein